jgi:hypothetical protein
MMQKLFVLNCLHKVGEILSRRRMVSKYEESSRVRANQNEPKQIMALCVGLRSRSPPAPQSAKQELEPIRADGYDSPMLCICGERSRL